MKFDKKKRAVTIGRGSKSDININDASVSRDQATIVYQDGAFYLESHSQKNSTCVLVRNRKVPFYMLNGAKIKFRGFLLEISTIECNVKPIKTPRSYSMSWTNAFHSLK